MIYALIIFVVSFVGAFFGLHAAWATLDYFYKDEEDGKQLAE